MEVLSSRIGQVEYRPEETLWFEEGLYGFEHLKRFILVQGGADTFFHYLVSLDDPQVVFVVCDPKAVVADYVLSIQKREYDLLGVKDPVQLLTFVIATIPDRVEDMTVNMLGPILVNAENFKGKQVIDQNPEYATKHRVFEAKPEAMATAG
jgi:flagellar assembly factor FliW